jgi:hypothetical protein
VLRVFGLVINELKLNLAKLFFEKDNYFSLLHFYLFLNNLARQKKRGRGIEAGFIRHCAYFYQAMIIPLKAPFSIKCIIYFCYTPT